MATTAERLLAVLAERDRRIDQAVNDFEEQTYRVAENVGRRIAQALNGNPDAVREPDGDDGRDTGQTRLERRISSFQDVDQLAATLLDVPIDEIDEFLQAAGNDLRDTQLRDAIATMAGYAEEALYVQGVPSARGILNTVAAEALIDNYLSSQVGGVLNDVIDGPTRNKIRAALAVNLAETSPVDLATQLVDRLESAIPSAMTEAETMIASADRFTDETVRASLESDNETDTPDYVMAYVGPKDPLTRPFCTHMVGHHFTIDQLNKANNAQGLNVRISGGGYNCRHRIMPVLESKALLDGLKLKKGTDDDIKKANDAAKKGRGKRRRSR